MRFRPCTVIVTLLPENLDRRQGRAFFRELENRMSLDRPCIVIECSKVRQMDRFAILMLLCCLEAAMKRDGDVKLAAIPSESRVRLEMTRVDRIFEIYDTETEAVNSFFRPRLEPRAYAGGFSKTIQSSETAP